TSQVQMAELTGIQVTSGGAGKSAAADSDAPNQSGNRFRAVLRSLRPHHWAKNLLVLAPLFLAHQVTVGHKALMAVIAFASFCACASAVYVVNDLLDLESDRRHAVKRHRPLAAGKMTPAAGIASAAALIVLGLTAAIAALPGAFVF